ncbi:MULTISPECIES: hypothetical protein [unclassified Bacillus (in: firmicutes)]|uniref:hypothetical protein n=1 Tax=unclassified Bacillus (in: firmicutes) TaxID=185979 RepID=UPI0027E02FA7|nr:MULTISPECIES: hypothetical protein [unclassified Bacillus (in: firmicutes)]
MRASPPIKLPKSYARLGSKLAASPSATGRAVALSCGLQSPPPRPTGPFVIRNVGISSSGMPGMCRLGLPHCGSSGITPRAPASCWIFWSSVIASSRSSERASGASDVSIQGNSDEASDGTALVDWLGDAANAPPTMDTVAILDTSEDQISFLKLLADLDILYLLLFELIELTVRLLIPMCKR